MKIYDYKTPELIRVVIEGDGEKETLMFENTDLSHCSLKLQETFSKFLIKSKDQNRVLFSLREYINGENRKHTSFSTYGISHADIMNLIKIWYK